MTEVIPVNSFQKSKSSPDLYEERTSSIRTAQSPRKNFKVKFDSSIFLDDLFKKAFRLSQSTSRTKKCKIKYSDEYRYGIGIDIVSYGAFSAKMACVSINKDGSFHSIQMVEDHIGSLRCSENSKISQNEKEFAEQFQLMMSKVFQLFGKRWYEMTDSDLRLPNTAVFKIVEQDQMPSVWFDEARKYSINKILVKFFLGMFECIGIDLENMSCKWTERITRLCVALPSDFHSYQRLCLKNCFEQIGLREKFLLVNKSTSLALPFMAKKLNDSSRKFIIDFGSVIQKNFSRRTFNTGRDKSNQWFLLLISKKVHGIHSQTSNIPKLCFFWNFNQSSEFKEHDNLNDETIFFIKLTINSLNARGLLGYMNSSIIECIDKKNLNVVDQTADRTISSRKFFEKCFKVLKHQAKSQNIQLNKTLTRYHLYKQMNTERITTARAENWTIKTQGKEFILNMKKLGIELLATSVIDKLKKTGIIDQNFRINDQISEILVCSDAVLYEHLEPLLKCHSNQGTNIIFMDNDCASIGAAFLSSSTLNLTSNDILPNRIGVGLYNGVIKDLINSRTNFPCSGRHLFQTLVDNQTMLRINLYEGESPLARYCKHISELVIEDIRKTLAGSAKIELKIEIDQNGVLSASAMDIDSNEELPVRVNMDSINCFETIKRSKYALKNVIFSRPDDGSDAELAKKLQDFDYFFDYLMHMYISKNRLKISNDDLDQVKVELEEVINENVPDFILFKLKFHCNIDQLTCDLSILDRLILDIFKTIYQGYGQI
ncbi:molecular chaperone [Brachionus plicatilis]|uniref:Molecular chaperone n=1 Tax=Brachionus plicatilis TaxID=10195 RepID=A0A3M7P433_BRAPC|nr:molecular chaperone [Brachionus plicatilis]